MEVTQNEWNRSGEVLGAWSSLISLPAEKIGRGRADVIIKTVVDASDSACWRAAVRDCQRVRDRTFEGGELRDIWAIPRAG